jgi:hypothetical protein
VSELPRTDELPRTEEGYDPARVEEAFAAFGDRVRDLEEVANELRAELRSLRAERAVPRTDDAEHWPVETAPAALSPDWVAAVPAPLAGGRPVPRLLLEAAFLLLVAVFAGLADLSVAWIALVMAGAWTLVVVGEWAAAARHAHWRLDEIAPPVPVGAAETTGPWDMPVVEATVVDAGPDPESQTIVTKLPAEPEELAPEPAPDPDAAPPRKRRLRLRRRKEEAETATADPWEN